MSSTGAKAVSGQRGQQPFSALLGPSRCRPLWGRVRVAILNTLRQSAYSRRITRRLSRPVRAKGCGPVRFLSTMDAVLKQGAATSVSVAVGRPLRTCGISVLLLSSGWGKRRARERGKREGGSFFSSLSLSLSSLKSHTHIHTYTHTHAHARIYTFSLFISPFSTPSFLSSISHMFLSPSFFSQPSSFL